MSLWMHNGDETGQEYLGPWESPEEGLEALRRQGYGIAFDVSRVPERLNRDPQLAFFELVCTVAMKSNAQRAVISLHEAAHAEYGERFGAPYAEFLPPHARCGPDGTLNYSVARTVVQPTREIGVLECARFALAAGIAEEVMVGQIPIGNRDDDFLKHRFDDWKVTPEHRKQVCEQARADVLKDLRSPMFRTNLWRRARFYQRILEHAIYPNGTPEARGVSDSEREAA
jgi:hypothetical protein